MIPTPAIASRFDPFASAFAKARSLAETLFASSTARRFSSAISRRFSAFAFSLIAASFGSAAAAARLIAIGLELVPVALRALAIVACHSRIVASSSTMIV